MALQFEYWEMEEELNDRYRFANRMPRKFVERFFRYSNEMDLVESRPRWPTTEPIVAAVCVRRFESSYTAVGSRRYENLTILLQSLAFIVSRDIPNTYPKMSEFTRTARSLRSLGCGCVNRKRRSATSQIENKRLGKFQPILLCVSTPENHWFKLSFPISSEIAWDFQDVYQA